MSKPVCDHPDCELEAEHKCNSCGRIFCLKHIAYFRQPWLQQWLCAEDVRKKVDSQKQIAKASIVAGGIGLFALILGYISKDSSLPCLGFILATGGFGIGIGMGIRYFSTQRSLNELFPEQKTTDVETLT